MFEAINAEHILVLGGSMVQRLALLLQNKHSFLNVRFFFVCLQ